MTCSVKPFLYVQTLDHGHPSILKPEMGWRRANTHASIFVNGWCLSKCPSLISGPCVGSLKVLYLKWESRSVMSDTLRLRGLYSPWNSPGQNAGVGSCSLLRGIFSTQELNPGLPHCRQILYQLSHKGSHLKCRHQKFGGQIPRSGLTPNNWCSSNFSRSFHQVQWGSQGRWKDGWCHLKLLSETTPWRPSIGIYLVASYQKCKVFVKPSGNQNKLWKILQEMGTPDHLTCLLRNLYAGQKATIRTRQGTTDWLKIGKGVCQGCILLSCLYNFYV